MRRVRGKVGRHLLVGALAAAGEVVGAPPFDLDELALVVTRLSTSVRHGSALGVLFRFVRTANNVV